MRSILPLICAAGALVSACDGRPTVSISSSESGSARRGVLTVVDALQCPETQGVLTRKGSAQAGGRICTYSGPKGAEVSLHLVNLNGAPPHEALRAFETQLTRGMAHVTTVPDRERPVETVAADGEQATAESREDGDRTRVRLPGVTIDTEGEKAHVRIGGLSIRADDSAGSVDIRSNEGRVSINSDDDGAEIRTLAAGDATRSSWLLTDSRSSEAGWRTVGYEARGPAGGPIVVATVRIKMREQDRVFDAAKALVTLNVGR